MNDEITSLEMRLLTLLHQARDEKDEVARKALNTLLRDNAEARDLMPRLLVDEQALVSQLREDGISELISPVSLVRSDRESTRWFTWRPLMAAAAGLVFGMFCTSVVFAYVRPTWETTITLLKESFEFGDAPLVTGVPTVPDRWSGDFTEVIHEEQGVKPEEGKKLLRFLRADYEGKANADGSRISDLYRLIDVRPYREQCADGGAVVQFSAGFNAAVFSRGDSYRCKMSLPAFDAQTVAAGPLHIDDMREGDELAAARTGKMKLDRDPATWQRVVGDLRLPANTDFVMVHLTVHHVGGTSPQGTSAGHYTDDVRLTLGRSQLK